jgi:fermentation-respiration switch protein FrsA (DUF1100 family)
MLLVLHWILVATYCILPAAAIGWAVVRRGGRWRGLMTTFTAAIILSMVLNFIYAQAVGGRAMVGQIALMAYFGTAMLLMLRIFDAGIIGALRRLLRLHPPLPRAARGRLWLAAGVRAAVLVSFVLPFVMAAVMIYRPKVALNDDPKHQLGWPFEPVSFESLDGVTIRGWWIPASPARRLRASDRTVILCHGLGANKANQLVLGRNLVRDYNILAIDLRAHGESGGHLSTLGDTERYDVLGAVRWLKTNRPSESQHLFGVGASAGAAALIAAAAEDSDEGRAIEALALYGTYDDLGALAQSISGRYFANPLRSLVRWVALPLAEIHAGRRLRQFRPADLIPALWPRPVFIIHGENDDIIDIRHGLNLFDSAVQPKDALWLPTGDHNAIIHNDAAARRVKRFLDTARPRAIL